MANNDNGWSRWWIITVMIIDGCIPGMTCYDPSCTSKWEHHGQMQISRKKMRWRIFLSASKLKEPRNPWSHRNSLGSYDGGSPTTMVYSLTSTTNNDLILMLGPQPWYLKDGSIRPSMVRFPFDQCDRQNEFLNSLTGNSRTELRWMILFFLVLPACSLICQWKGLHLHLLNLLEMAIVHGYVWLLEGDA